MNTKHWALFCAPTLTLFVGCGSDDEGGSSNPDTSSGGASDGSGGAAAAGGTAGSTGGAATGNGGTATGNGGAAAAGGAASGGAAAGGAANDDAGTGGAADTDSGAGGNDGGTPDAGPADEVVTKIVSLSKSGHDRFFGVTSDAAGNLYAAGQVSGGIEANDDYAIAVAKFLPTGEIDTTFGNDGVATKNLTPGGTARELARGIVVQASGKIVVSATTEHDPKVTGILATDTDMALVRFETTGALDQTFGDQGVIRIDLSTGVETVNGQGNPAVGGADQAWSLALAAGDQLVLHGVARAAGFKADGTTPRADTDWALLRFSADGVPDATFSGDGKVTLDIAEGGASARSATVLADGSIVAAGYTRTEVLGTSSQQPVLYKVLENGDFDTTFATEDSVGLPGVWHDYAAPGGAEAYGAVKSGDHFVTIGYGPTENTAGTGSDWVSFRFDEHGVRDTTYGTAGVTWLDVGLQSDNGRGLLALPDGRVMGFGGGKPVPAVAPPEGTAPETDAMIAVLGTDGLPDETFAEHGYRLFDVGGNADFLWSGTILPDGKHVAAVGIAGAETSANDDDGLLVIVPFSK